MIGGYLIAFAASVGAMTLGTLLICAGMHPETIAALDTLAVLIGLSLGAGWAGSRNAGSGWKRGLAIGLVALGVWLLAWGYVTSRLFFSMWWQQAIAGLTALHLMEWALGLLISTAAGALGQQLRARRQIYRWLASAALVLLVPAAMLLSQARRGPEVPLADLATSPNSQVIAKGVTLRTSPPDAEGTTVRLLKFDFATNPDLHLRLYDADSDDYGPYDDANTTFLGQSIDFVLNKLRSRTNVTDEKVVALFNAGFFGGSSRWIAAHEAPIVVDGQKHYNLNMMREKWDDQAWVFGVVRSGTHTRFELVPEVRWSQLERYDTAISGLRPLRVNGAAKSLDPGAGAPGLRCSRTSIGWSAESRSFYLLIVREPDGEAASIRQRRAKVPQLGGWTAAQVLQFWERTGIPNAVLCDSGESTQLCYPTGSNSYNTVRSSYNLSRTIGYWRSRPIRLIVPALPHPLSQGGVLNYFYITGKR